MKASMQSAHVTALLVTMPEIAELAQVQRPVVTNWRRRHPDFPSPVTSTGNRLLFDGTQVVAWLLDTGLGNAPAEELRADLSLYGIVAQADPADPMRSVETIAALVCLRFLAGQPLNAEEVLHRAQRLDPDDEFILRELASGAEQPETLTRLHTLSEDLIEAAYGERGAYEWLLAARSRLGLSALSADATAPELQHLMAQLTEVKARVHGRTRLVLADPHARGGDLLTALIREADQPDQLTAIAAEPDGRMARLLRRRLLLAGIDETSLDVQHGDALEEGIGDPDLIITQLPYSPGESRSVLAALDAVDRIALMLAPGRTAVVLGPAAALVDALPGVDEAARRSELLRSGLLEAVIALPGGTLPYRPGYRPALWVLTSGPVQAAEGRVLLADVSAGPLDENVRARLTEDVLLWRAEGYQARGGHDPRYGQAVRIAELERRFGGPLTPPVASARHYWSAAVRERPALIAEAEARLERAGEELRAYEDVHGPYQGGVIRRVDGDRPGRTTLGSLITQGKVALHKGHRLQERHVGREGHHRVIGPDEILGRAAIGARSVDRLVLAAEYEQVALTEPGDLVYTMAPELGLYVDREGFSVIEFPARVLRPAQGVERPLTGRVLAALLGAAGGGTGTGRSPSAVRAARRITDFPLPDLGPQEVQRFDALLAEAERREQLLRARAAALAEARQLTAAGLADGTLTLDRRY
jgi:hypothetical protein